MRTSRSNRGFGLVEVLVAIALFTVGIVALADLVGSMKREAAMEEQRVAALAVAREKIEEMRLNPDNLASMTKTTGTTVLIPSDRFEPVAGRPGLGWQASATRDAAQPERINITVRVARLAQSVAIANSVPVETGGFILTGAKAATGGVQ